MKPFTLRKATRAFERAEHLAALGDHEAAIRTYGEALKLAQEGGHPVFLAASAGMAASMVMLGEIDAAVAELSESIEASAARGDTQGAGRAAGQLGLMLQESDRLEDAKSWHERSLMFATVASDLGNVARAHYDLGVTLATRGDEVAAIEEWDSALEDFRSIGDRAGVVATLESLATHVATTGDHSRAVKHLTELLDLVTGTPEEHMIFALLCMLRDECELAGEWDGAMQWGRAVVDAVAMDADRAETELVRLMILTSHAPPTNRGYALLEQCEAAADLLRAARPPHDRVRWLDRDAGALSAGGAPKLAEQLWQRAVELADHEDDPAGRALCWLNLGLHFDDRDRADSAEQCFRLSAYDARQAGDATTEGHATCYLAILRSAAGARGEAVELMDKAAQLHRQVGDVEPLAFTLTEAADLHREAGDTAREEQVLAEALVLLDGPPSPPLRKVVLRLGMAHTSAGRDQEAIPFLVRAVDLAQSLGELDLVASIALFAARTEARLGQHTRGLAHARRGLEAYQTLGDRQGELSALLCGAEMLGALGDSAGAAEEYDSAVRIAASMDGDARHEAHEALGGYAQRTGDLVGAVTAYKRAVELSSHLPDQAQQLRSLLELTVALSQRGDRVEAADTARQGLSLAYEVGDSTLLASALINYCVVDVPGRTTEETLEMLSSARSLSEGLGDLETAATCDVHIAVLHRKAGEYTEAVELLERARSRAQSAGARDVEAQALKTLGTLYRYMGAYGRARASFEDAAELQRALNDRLGLIDVIANLGVVHYLTGEPQHAFEHYLEALTLARELGLDDEADLLSKSGLALKDLDRPEEALQLFEMALASARKNEDRALVASTLINIAHEYAAVDKALERALRAAREAVQITSEDGWRSLEVQARALLGGLLEIQGDHDAALVELRLASGAAADLGFASAELTALQDLSFLFENRGDRREALTQARLAVEALERLREGIDDPRTREDLVHEKVGVYQNVVRLHGELGEWHEAFAYVQRGKARSTLDSISEALVGVRRGVDRELLAEEQRVHAEIEAAQRDLSEDLPTNDVTSLVLHRRRLEEDLSRVQRRIREQTPQFAALREVQTCGLEELQKEVLLPGEVLLEYSFDGYGLTTFVVTRDQFLAHRADDAAEVVQSARRLVEALHHVGNRTFPGDCAHALYERLIDQPLAELRTRDELCSRLVVCPDGILHYLPYECLASSLSGSGVVRAFLVEELQLSYAASASVLALARGMDLPRGYSRDLLAVAPFSELDDDMSMDSRGLRSELAELVTSPRPLPYSEVEIQGVAHCVDRALCLRGNEATEARVRMEIAGNRYVHLATHAYADPDRPAYSGLLLYGDVLQAHEILDLVIDAELTVLSACDTGHGRMRLGEGLVGLSRAVMYAGSPSLLVSLWRVADQSTAQLMIRFYEALASGSGHAAALRAAKIAMIKEAPGVDEFGYETSFSDPYYWAPFVLIGAGR